MSYEDRTSSLVHDYKKKFPKTAEIVPYLMLILEGVLLYFCLRDAFLTAGNISWKGVYLAVGAFFLAGAAMIEGGVVLMHRSMKPWIPIIGILLNAIVFFAVLVVYAIGF